MTFTQIPPEYAPLGGELRYTVTTPETATLDLRIADAGNGMLIGAKRFAGITSASFDAAPTCGAPSRSSRRPEAQDSTWQTDVV